MFDYVRCDSPQAAFLRATVCSITPMMSLSFMIKYSTPSILTSVPDHLPNSTRSPTLRSMGMIFPASSRPPGPTDHLSLRRLLFSGIWNDDSACGLIVSVDARNHDPVVKRPKLHMHPPKYPFWLSFPTKSRGSLSYETIPLPCKWSAFGTLQGRLPIPIDRAQQMIARNVPFERELIEQRSPFDCRCPTMIPSRRD